MADVKKNYKPAKTVDDLASQLGSYGYMPRTDAERRSSAEAMYAGQRDQAKLQAQQAYETGDLALQQQLEQLGVSYGRQADAQRENTAKSVSAADRMAQSRGMGRSSYNNATVSNVRLAGDKALAQIEQDRTNAESALQGQRAQLANQYQQNLNAADSAFEQSVIARMKELEDQDYTRGQSATDSENQLLMQLYQLGQKGSSGGGGGTGSATATAQQQATSQYPTLGGLLGGRNYSYDTPVRQTDPRQNLKKPVAAKK